MARIRTIKPEFPQSGSMGRVSREARLFFVLLWTLADDYGRLRGDSRLLVSLLYPYDNDAFKHIESWAKELEDEGCIQRYKHGNDLYVCITNWQLHQKIDRPSGSKMPAPPEIREDASKAREDASRPREDSRGCIEASCEDQGPRIKDQGPRTKPIPPSADIVPDRFEEFWDAFPKRAGSSSKKNARTKFLLYSKKTDPQTIIDGAIRYKAFCDSNGNTGTPYVKAADAWLNAALWESEYAIQGKEAEDEVDELPSHILNALENARMKAASGLR